VNLAEIVQRTNPPLPWQEGDNIPWSEPDFSRRMLAEHLTQAHDRASRRSHLIDAHVNWIHEQLLGQKASRILDLGCGPGLYCQRLATLGHQCTGIDYSPASVDYAQLQAQQQNLSIRYLHADIRFAAYFAGDDEEYDLVMLLFGEFNVFSRADAAQILAKSLAVLRPGGLLLLETHRYSSLIPNPQARNTWFSSSGGLFSPLPHFVLMEESWEQQVSILTRRYYVIDTTTAVVTRYAQSMQAYRFDEYQAILSNSGFTAVAIVAGLAHDRICAPPEFHAIVARK